MATLRKHGGELGRYYNLTTCRAYMADGTVLVHSGLEWRIYSKVKPGISPQEAWEQYTARCAERLKTHPAYAEYRRQLHDMAPQSKRWLQTAISVMPEDPDGVWSTLADSCDPRQQLDLDIGEVCSLCRAYLAAVSESDADRKRKA